MSFSPVINNFTFNDICLKTVYFPTLYVIFSPSFPDPCVNGCGKNAICVAENHHKTCNCPAGMTGDAYGRGCKAIRFCESHPCHPTAKCVDTKGSYKCQCPLDYIGDPFRWGTNPNPLPTTICFELLHIENEHYYEYISNMEIWIKKGVGISYSPQNDWINCRKKGLPVYECLPYCFEQIVSWLHGYSECFNFTFRHLSYSYLHDLKKYLSRQI